MEQFCTSCEFATTTSTFKTTSAASVKAIVCATTKK